MTAPFKAEAIVRTDVSADLARLEVAFVDSKGVTQVVSLPVSAAGALLSALSCLEAALSASGPAPTKLPRHFAVGAGRYEPLVLLQFEDDIPYALPASEATELAEALLDQAELISDRAEARVQ